MNSKKSILSMAVAFIMLVTTVLGNVCSVFADDVTANIGDSIVIDDAVSGTPSYKGTADNQSFQVGSSALYTVSGIKDVKVTGAKKTYNGVTYKNCLTTAGKGVFNSDTKKLPKQCAVKITPTVDCKVVVYAFAPNGGSKDVNFNYMVDGNTDQFAVGEKMTTEIAEYAITGLKANVPVYFYGDADKINVCRVDVLADNDAPQFTGADIAADVKVGDVKSNVEFSIGATGDLTFNVTENSSKLIDSYEVNDKTVEVKLAKGTDVSKVVLSKTSEDKYAFTGTAPNFKMTVNNVDYTINFVADKAFEGRTFNADVVVIEREPDIVTTTAGIEITVNADGEVSAKVANDDNKIISDIKASGKVIDIILVNGYNAETTEMVEKVDDITFLKQGAKYTFEINNEEYTINLSTEGTYVPVEDVNIPLKIKYDNVSAAAIDVVIGENSSAKVSSDEKVVKGASVKDSVITVTLNENLKVSLVDVVANGFDVKGSNGSFTLTKDGKEYTVKIVSSGSTEDSTESTSESTTESTTADLDGKIAVPVSVSVKKPSANTNLPFNDDGSVKRVSLDDYLTEKGFYALVPSYGAPTSDGGTENYMTVSTNATLRTRGNGSVDKRCIRFTPAADGFVTKFVFSGASGNSATTAYFQQVGDDSTKVAFAQNIAKGAKFNSAIALPVKAGLEYAIYSDVSMDISSIEISEPKDVFQGAAVKLDINYDGVKAESTLNIDANGKLSVADVETSEGAVLTKAEVDDNTVTYTISLKENEDLSKLSVAADESYKLEGSGKAYTVTVNGKIYNIKFVFSINGQAPAEEEMTSNAKYSVEVTDTDKEDNKLIVTLKLNDNDLKLTGIQGNLAYDGTLLKAVKAVAVDGALSYNGNSFVNVDNINKSIANSADSKLKIVGETLTNGGDTIADVTDSGVLCAIEFEIIKSGNAFVEFASTYANAKNSRGQIVPVVSIANAETVNAEVTKIGGQDPTDPTDPSNPDNPNPDKPGTETYLHLAGDYNCDTKVTAQDAALIIKDTLMPASERPTSKDADLSVIADVNGQSGVTASDAAEVIKKTLSVGGSYTFKVGNTVKVTDKKYAQELN